MQDDERKGPHNSIQIQNSQIQLSDNNQSRAKESPLIK